MQKWNGQLLRKFDDPTEGNASVGTTVVVRKTSDNSLAVIYDVDDVNSVQKNNPFVTDDFGRYSFYAPSGKYTVEFGDGSDSIEITLNDTLDFRDVDHNELANRNAVGAHDASAISRGSSDVNADLYSVENSVASLSLATSSNALAIAGLGDSVTVVSNRITSAEDDINALQLGQGSSVYGYATKALMDADLIPVDQSIAYVTNDATAANNGTYRKSGATGAGSWVQASTDLASQAYQLSTGNADIIARDYVDVPIVSPVDGSYINGSGTISSNATFTYKSIPVLAGELYYVQGYINSAARIFKANGAVFPTVDAPATNTRYGGFVYIKANGDLEVSFVKTLPYSVQRVKTLAELPSVVNQINTDITGFAGTGGIKAKMDTLFETVSYTLTTGYYVNASGGVTANAGWGYVDIPVSKGDVYYIKGKTAEAARLYFIDGAAFPTSNTTGQVEFSRYLVAKSDGNLRVGFLLSSYYEIKKLAISEFFEPLSTDGDTEYDNLPYTPEVGFYLSLNNEKVALATYTYSEVPVTAGDVIKVSGSIQSGARLLYANNTIFPEVMGADGAYTFEVIIDEDGIIKVGYQTSQPFTLKINNSLKVVGEAIADLRGQNSLASNEHLRSYHNVILCAGDSLTSGGNYQPPQTGLAIEECYPYFLNRISKWNIHCQARIGIDPQNYWTDYSPIIDGALYDGVILWLGTNGGLTDTLAADTSSGDYNTYANTGTGRYCSIVEKLLTENPKLTIYLTHIYSASGSTVAISNDVINQIQAKYSALGYRVFVMIPDVDFMTNPFWHEYNAVHFTKMGNEAIASHFYEKVINLIADNRKKYDVVDKGLRVSNYFGV